MQNQSRTDSDAIVARLMEESTHLRLELESTERELEDVRVGRKEDEAERRAIKTEVKRLTDGKVR